MVGCDSILIIMEDLPQIGFNGKLNLSKSTMKNVNFIKENTFLGYQRRSLEVVVQKLQEVYRYYDEMKNPTPPHSKIAKNFTGLTQ